MNNNNPPQTREDEFLEAAFIGFVSALGKKHLKPIVEDEVIYDKLRPIIKDCFEYMVEDFFEFYEE